MGLEGIWGRIKGICDEIREIWSEIRGILGGMKWIWGEMKLILGKIQWEFGQNLPPTFSCPPVPFPSCPPLFPHLPPCRLDSTVGTMSTTTMYQGHARAQCGASATAAT